jgi:hypothetical protein
MTSLSDREYYGHMLSSMMGLRDDLEANHAPAETRELIDELIKICVRDFTSRFGSLDGVSGP